MQLAAYFEELTSYIQYQSKLTDTETHLDAEQHLERHLLGLFQIANFVQFMLCCEQATAIYLSTCASDHY